MRVDAFNWAAASKTSSNRFDEEVAAVFRALLCCGCQLRLAASLCAPASLKLVTGTLSDHSTRRNAGYWLQRSYWRIVCNFCSICQLASI